MKKLLLILALVGLAAFAAKKVTRVGLSPMRRRCARTTGSQPGEPIQPLPDGQPRRAVRPARRRDERR